MRHFVLLAAFAAATAQAQAQEVRRLGPADSPISASVEGPPGSRLLYFSGTLPPPAHPAAPAPIRPTLRRRPARSSATATPPPRPARFSPRSRPSSDGTA